MKYDYRNFVMPSQEELREMLTKEQYEITQEERTERPFNNEYYDNKEAGIYVDVISKYPLFSSLDKFDSGSGWPSFTKPLPEAKIIEKDDFKFGMHRVEAISSSSNSHLGHIFDDGPSAAGGKRYCMNSAALEFIPVDKLAEYGYEEYLPLF